MKKIVIVVADGRVETVFANEDVDVDVEIVDFDGLISEGEQQEAGDYVDACRATMKEISC